MSERRSSGRPVAFAGASSHTAACVVAPSSRPSKAAQTLEERVKKVVRAYQELQPLVQEPEVKAAIKSAAPYTPADAPKTDGKPFTRWDWFQDYIGCKVTGGAGLYGFLHPDALKQDATSLQHKIDAQKHLFDDYVTLLKEHQPTARNPAAFDAAIEAFGALKQATIKLRHAAADVAEGRITDSLKPAR